MDVSVAKSAGSIPPVQTVARLQRALSEAGIDSVVGGSGLLASLGLTDEVHDWDVVIDASSVSGGSVTGEPAAGPSVGTVHAVERVLDAMGLPHRRRERYGIFHTAAAILVDAGDHGIDVLIGFALESAPESAPGSGGTVVEIPARPGGRWRGLQMARPQEWALAYRLMGRTERAATLQRHLDR